MTWQWAPYTILLIAATTIPVILALYTLRHRLARIGLESRMQQDNIRAITRETDIENLTDGIIALDAQNRVVGLNSTAQRLIGCTTPEIIGHSIEQVWADWPQQAKGPHKVVLGEGSERRTYKVRISPLADWRDRSASQVVILQQATEHRQTEQALQQSVAELWNLQHITETLLSLEGLPQVIHTIAEGTVTHLGYDTVLVSRYVEEENVFTGLSLYPTPVQFDQFLELIYRPDLKDAPADFQVPYQRGDNPIIDRVLNGEIVTSDSLADFFHPWVPRPAATAAQRLLGIQTYVDVPMQVKGKTVGTILAGVRGTFITTHQQQALARVAGQAAVAIENARLYKAESQRSEELARSNAFITALSQVAARIEIASDPNQVLETMGEELERLGTTCFLFLLEPDAQELVGHYTSVNPATLAQAEKMAGLTVHDFRIPCESWPLSQVIQSGQALFAPNLVSTTATLLPRLPRPLLERAARLVGIPSDTAGIYLPLKVEEEVLGILAVWSLDLREEDIPTLSVFANQVAVTFGNARLYARAQQEITERRQVEGQVTASLKEKELLLQEIHHRVKNNLQIISSLLNLQSEHVEDPQTLQSFQESRDRIRSMALIHEKLYQAPDLTRIDFADYIHNLTRYLCSAYSTNAQAITLNIKADDVFMTIDTAVPCGLVLNELISNALKHAFPDGRAGQIHINLDKGHDYQFFLQVSDDGIGLPPDLDLSTTESLGLQLVNTLVSQLGGTIEFDRSNGTKFKIVFATSQN